MVGASIFDIDISKFDYGQELSFIILFEIDKNLKINH